MKDIPVFTTEFGVASLILREIPYREESYVRIQAVSDLEKLLCECVSFCRSAGAKAVYATGNPGLESYPFHTAMLRMRREKEGLPDTDAALWPVQKQTLETWRTIFNQRMAGVPNAAFLTLEGAKEMLQKGDGYFVHRGEQLLGIGQASDEQLDVVVSCFPGGGRETVLALCHAITGPTVSLEVASVNERAVRLYERLGFLTTAELSRWYKIS